MLGSATVSRIFAECRTIDILSYLDWGTTDSMASSSWLPRWQCWREAPNHSVRWRTEFVKLGVVGVEVNFETQGFHECSQQHQLCTVCTTTDRGLNPAEFPIAPSEEEESHHRSAQHRCVQWRRMWASRKRYQRVWKNEQVDPLECHDRPCRTPRWHPVVRGERSFHCRWPNINMREPQSSRFRRMVLPGAWLKLWDKVVRIKVDH